MGVSLSPMRAGHEVPEYATLLPVVLADDLGKPAVFENGLAIYEQDGGMVWTHTDSKEQEGRTQRRQLVLRKKPCTPWATMIIACADLRPGWQHRGPGPSSRECCWSRVSRKRSASSAEEPRSEAGCVPAARKVRHAGCAAYRGHDHQHFFNFRLDFDLEGVGNTVYEVELVPEDPVPSNPDRNAFILDRASSEASEARRDLDHRTHRAWKVLNPNRQTALGHFPAYKDSWRGQTPCRLLIRSPPSANERASSVIICG